ncbi:hypothetical protein BJY52DRAFT_427359 [Lactarius psammicola]|nr:hypothetical protein BJY52DRAFT_427359 [Lactarius psammicola]
MCALLHLHRRHSVRGSLIHCHLIDRLCSGDEHLSTVSLLSLSYDDPVRDPVSILRMQCLASRYHSDLLPHPRCDLMLFLLFFSAVSFRLRTTPFNFVGLLAYPGYGRPVIPRPVCDLGMGCPSLVHWRHLQSFDLVSPPVTVLPPRGRCFGSFMMFEAQ